MTTAVTAAFDDVSPSAKLIYKTLEYEGECTQKELVEETRLVARTVRNALTQLEEAGLIEKQVSVEDARQRLYTIAD